jgi:hypoxanthine-guanine phosphoribosyltransferase
VVDEKLSMAISSKELLVIEDLVELGSAISVLELIIEIVE